MTQGARQAGRQRVEADCTLAHCMKLYECVCPSDLLIKAKEQKSWEKSASIIHSPSEKSNSFCVGLRPILLCTGDGGQSGVYRDASGAGALHCIVAKDQKTPSHKSPNQMQWTSHSLSLTSRSLSLSRHRLPATATAKRFKGSKSNLSKKQKACVTHLARLSRPFFYLRLKQSEKEEVEEEEETCRISSTQAHVMPTLLTW